MNFNIPLYDVNGNDMPQNTTVYIVQIKQYLCPSDVRDHVLPDQAPSNYCVEHRRWSARRLRPARLVR